MLTIENSISNTAK